MGQYKGVMGGIDSMMAARFTPWHYSYNEDRVSLTELTIESGHQALVMAGCDWGVNLVNMAEFMPDHLGAEDFYLALRSDKQALLGVHKERYAVIVNQVLADLADAVITAAPGANIISCGSLYEPGKQVWMLVELPPSGMKLGGREVHDRYVLIVTSHDGSLSLSVRATRVRVECMNTMSFSLGTSRADYVIRHTTNALNYVEEARRAIASANAHDLAFDHAIEQLIDTELTVANFATQVLPKVIDVRPEKDGRGQTVWDEKFAAIINAYGADHNTDIIDTAWGAVNAVNEYEEWGIKPRGQELHERQMGMLVKGDYPLTKRTLALVS
jgi:phage/plasmid-like protein (TIGR03299 family)